ncbi:nucleotidyltransferase family protein [Pseudomonas sp. 18175]|uniref:nucleotidyltransferase family protein n=1 Tax=Pseudomonas sp. 18175 TaxID=3390056 RepID=UPI003D1CE2ED
MTLTVDSLLELAMANPINAEITARLPALGVEVATGEVYAPYGLEDVEQGVLRINPLHPERALFEQKARSYQARWPWLRIIEAG